jgi:BirA family biotin operon repressor/biotin-[acetyl-CoA-carboxylase] ligase
MSEARPRLPAACTLLSYDRLGSSNDEAKRLARDGAREWTVIWTREQTAGRGRRGRQWTSIPGNLYVSIILRPRCTPAEAAQLGFVAALGAGEAIAKLAPPGAELRYKWPNDVLLNGGKIVGILLESEMTEAGALAWLVAGVGINVTDHPPETAYPATSLRAAGGADVGAGRMLEAFAERFFTWTGRWLAEGFAPVRAAWLAGATGLGEAITARLEREEIVGRFAGIDADGALLLETPAGERRITVGDVFPVRGREGSL